MQKFQVLALTLLACLVFTAIASAQVSVVYYAEDVDDPTWGNNPAGTFIVDNGGGRTITTFEAISAGNLWIPGNIAAGTIAPPFDIISEQKLFKLAAGDAAFANINFGNILPAGLTAEQIAADMSIDGSLTPDGSGNNSLDANGFGVTVVSAIPEPSSIALIGCGLLGLLSFRRKRS